MMDLQYNAPHHSGLHPSPCEMFYSVPGSNSSFIEYFFFIPPLWLTYHDFPTCPLNFSNFSKWSLYWGPMNTADTYFNQTLLQHHRHWYLKEREDKSSWGYWTGKLLLRELSYSHPADKLLSDKRELQKVNCVLEESTQSGPSVNYIINPQMPLL